MGKSVDVSKVRVYLRHSCDQEWVDVTDQTTVTINQKTGLPSWIFDTPITAGPETETRIEYVVEV